ncbi:MAG TPA: hypothetical protein VKV40_24015 [Ktedonobacteraceae bacterium]|nr:hypothetical protein [Ktedonobacteraceae bacterium]
MAARGLALQYRYQAMCPATPYRSPAGFDLPYGDYFQMVVDDGGHTQAAFGEGPSYADRGNIWASHSL